MNTSTISEIIKLFTTCKCYGIDIDKGKIMEMIAYMQN